MSAGNVIDEVLEQAKDGDPFAQVFMGHLLHKGIQTPADKAGAEDWYRRSADLGFAPGA